MAREDWRDVRLTGFADRASLATAWGWLDAVAVSRAAVPLVPEIGRVLAADVRGARSLPAADLAVRDGYAVRAADTEGASAYGPLPLALGSAAGAGRACLVAAGTTLPPGSDAVLPFEAASRSGPEQLDALDAVAAGDGVARRGSLAREGAVVLPAGRRLRPSDVALLRSLGIATVPLHRRPVTRLAIAGPKDAAAEAFAPMLSALVRRDGGAPVPAGLEGAFALPEQADLILVAGRSGAGADDVAAPSLIAAGGRLALHGIALRPGGSSGLGQVAGTPVILLPGEPLACLASYEMLAARLVRRLAWLAPDLPHPALSLPLARKIVSAIGCTDMVQVAVADGVASPIGSADTAGLAAACLAGGFVIVPEGKEGYGVGESVVVHLYDPA